jgi:esterase
MLSTLLMLRRGALLHKHALADFHQPRRRSIGLRHFARTASSSGPNILSTEEGGAHKNDPQKTPITFLHGMLGNKNNFKGAVKSMHDDVRAILVDLTNHGHSPHDDSATISTMADDVHETLKRSHDVTSSMILGHSLGGKVAAELALKNPDLVDALCIVDISPVPYPNYHSNSETAGVMEAMNALDLQVVKDRRHAESIVDIKPLGLKKFALTNLVSAPDKKGLVWRCNLDGLYSALGDISLHEFDGVFDKPVLLITGSKSNFVKDEHMGAFQTFFPKFVHTEIKGAGHWVHGDAPVVFNDVVREFFANPVAVSQRDNKKLVI